MKPKPCPHNDNNLRLQAAEWPVRGNRWIWCPTCGALFGPNNDPNIKPKWHLPKREKTNAK